MGTETFEYHEKRAKRTRRERVLVIVVSVLILLIGASAAFLLYNFVTERNAAPKSYFDFQLRQWKAALEKNPKDPAAHTNVGYIYGKMGEDSTALYYYNAALKLDKKYVPALYNKALYYKENGKKAEALELLKIAAKNAEVGNKYLAYYTLGDLYIEDKKYDKAIEVLEAAAVDNTAIWNTFEKLGRVYELKKNNKKALENYEKAAAFNPDNAKLAKKVKELKSGKR